MPVISQIVPGVQNRNPKDAKKSVTITIKPEHFKKAKRCNGKECVVAQAFQDSNIGEYTLGVEVGISIIKVSTPLGIIRYATPYALRPAIRHFDRTGKWNMPTGDYTLNPPSPTARLGGRPSRWKKHRKGTDGTGQDKMVVRAVPTRRIAIDRIK